MYKNKLIFRIALTVILSVFVIGAALGFLVLREQRQGAGKEALGLLTLSTAALQGDICRSIKQDRYESLTQTLAEVAGQLNAHAFTLMDPEGDVLVEEVMTPDYKPQSEGLGIKLRMLGATRENAAEILKTPAGKVLRFLSPIRDKDGQLVGGLEMELSPSPAGAAQEQNLWKTLASILIVAVFVASIVTLVQLFLVVRPINVIKDELEILSRGEADLTFQVDVKTHDEIGEMGYWFNSFIGRIRAMVLRVLEHSQQLSEQVKTMTHSTAEVSAMSEDVTTTVQQIAKGAEEQAVKIAEVSHMMQNMQETMREVETKAHETAAAVDRATQTAKVGGKLAQGTINRMGDLNEIILKNAGMVGRLGQKSQQVGRAVEIINGIAEQTNLLSLNAAIEAARAGEQGRGFAVVAEEIKTLSDAANRATQEISSLVDEIQNETKAVVESMEKGAQEAQGGKDSIRQMEGSLDEIIQVIENVATHSRSITEMVSSQTQSYTKILHSIQDVNAVSEESAASTEEVSASTEEQSASMEQVNATCKELAAMAEELRSMVGKFKIQ